MLVKYKLSELGKISTGNTPSKRNNEFYDSRDIMFIKPDDIKNGITEIQNSKEYLSNKAATKARIVPKDSLLITCIGSIGKIAINKEKSAFNQQINSIVHNEKVISSRYLAYVIMKNRQKLEAIANAPVVPIINKTQFSEFKVEIHNNKEEQEKIVLMLDKAQSLIDKRKVQIEALNELVKSRFIEMFGDPVKSTKGWKIKKLQSISSVGSSKRVFVDELVENGIPFYRGTEIGSMSTEGNITPTLFITEEHYNRLKESTGVPTIEDLLMPSICPDGRIWRVDTDDPFYFKDGRVLWIHLENSDIDSIYLQYMLHEKFIRDYNKIASGTTFAELKIFALKRIDIMIPPIELQIQFADFVKQVDKLKFEMKKSLKELEDNFNSLMQRAFKGELFN